MTRREAAMIAEEMHRLTHYEEPYITRKDAAAYLSVSESFLAKNLTIPSYRFLGNVRYRKSELDKWVSSQN